MADTTHGAMIEAAAKIKEMMPSQPKTCRMGNREAQLVFSVFEEAAKAAYRRAAHECFNVAFSANRGGGVDFSETHGFIKDEKTLKNLIEMCGTDFCWGGNIKNI